MFKPLRTNNQIRVPKVQVIDDHGNQLGIMNTFDALKVAKERELDLVEVNPNAQPPMAKIMDYGKYAYQKEKQEKGSKKPKDKSLKTVRVGFKTGEHDMSFKAKQIHEFLKDGSVVKIELTLRGREKALAEIGRKKLETFLTKLEPGYIIQDQIKRSPFGWTILIKK